MRVLIALLASAVLATGASAATIFQQNFSSSSTVSDYVSATPNIGQFNAIGTSNGNATIAITSGALAFTRSADPNGTTFSRTTDFSPTPDAIMYQFTLNVTGNTAAQTTAAVFQVGSGYGTANSAETNANTYGRIGVNLGSNAGEYALRNIGASTNSPTLTGPQDITWVLNNSGATLNYMPPAGGSTTVLNDTADVYAGNTLLFDDIAVTTTTQTMTDLKFAFTAGFATISIDNMLITAIPEPVSMTSLLLVGGLLFARRRA
jgi:hypothetical protein